MPSLSQIPQLVALAIVLLLCLSLLVTHAATGVPTLSANPAEKADVIALLRLADLPDGALIYDLGCGWGAQLVSLSQAFPHARIRGIELSPFPWFVSRLRARKLPNVEVRRSNFLKADLADAQAVVCYLMPRAMPADSELIAPVIPK